jgi:hypothetical protein
MRGSGIYQASLFSGLNSVVSPSTPGWDPVLEFGRDCFLPEGPSKVVTVGKYPTLLVDPWPAVSDTGCWPSVIFEDVAVWLRGAACDGSAD